MHATTITTSDGITLHLATDATLWHHTDSGETSIPGIAALQARPIDQIALNSTRDWEYVEGQPWTWQTSEAHSRYSTPAVAGFDAGDEAAVAAATAWVAHRARRPLADAAARRVYTDRERTRATAEAERLRPQITPGGRGRAMTALGRLRSLHCTLTARGLLAPDEIEDITGLDSVPGLPDHGTDRPRILYGPAEIAIRSGLARGTIDRYIVEGRLPHEAAPRLWEPEDIEAWIDARQ